MFQNAEKFMTEAQERQALYPRPERRDFTAKNGNCCADKAWKMSRVDD
jgi:hypothetical protein